MSDKKRNKDKKISDSKKIYSKHIETFDDTLENIMQETLSAVTMNEVYPRGYAGENIYDEEDDTQIYYTERERYRKTGRYEQSPDTVAQHMEDRTQFRH